MKEEPTAGTRADDKPGAEAGSDDLYAAAIEAAAAEEYRFANSLIEKNRIRPARRHLQVIISKYPESEAAAKAKQRFQSLPPD